MPIARYFMVAGSALAVLLLIAGWSLPEPPASFPDRPEVIERAAIRIRSERKWPEKVVLDTSQPTIPPPSIEVAPAEQSVARLPDETTDQTSVDSLAKLNSGAARAFSSTHMARARNRNELPTLATGEECCRSEWADRSAISKAASRKRVARRDSWTGWHFPEAN